MPQKGLDCCKCLRTTAMDSITELFLPDTLPPWSKLVVLGFLALHVLAFSAYAVCLCRECSRPKEQYSKVKLAKDT